MEEQKCTTNFCTNEVTTNFPEGESPYCTACIQEFVRRAYE